MSEHKFPWKWRIADGYPAKGVEKHGRTVFELFACGGGSSMGHKLAGYNALGGVELDPKVANTYILNHHPKYMYTEDVRVFNDRTDLPDELYNLDLLSMSPPCTTFSMSGLREKVWGKEKKFSEGQKEQRLDDLVFVSCDTIEKLRPKCFVLENVAGLVKGNAKSYVRRIIDRVRSIGYDVQIFQLNGADMGVPQTRERVFFVGHRAELRLPKIELHFREEAVPFGSIRTDEEHERISDYMQEIWSRRRYGDRTLSDICSREYGKQKLFNHCLIYLDRPVPTLTTAACSTFLRYDAPVKLTDREVMYASTFPEDYDSPYVPVTYLCGMSVPPVMMAQISHQIYLQWLSRI